MANMIEGIPVILLSLRLFYRTDLVIIGPRCFSDQRRVGTAPDYPNLRAMSAALMTFLRNYHWKDYEVESVQNTPTMGMNLHRGKFPIHRVCRNVNVECRAFNLSEVYTWINNEKWNILWVDDESWLPDETTVNVGATLPHGFHKVIPSECDEVFLHTWLTIAGYGGFYPFAAEVRHNGYACWANSRRFAIVARNAQQCAVIAEIMHAYNILGNRIETVQPLPEGTALTEQARINSAVHEDDRPCYDFRLSEKCRNAIAGRFPNHEEEADRIFQLSEGILMLQRHHNDLVHKANRSLYRLQQSWHTLSEAYAALFSDLWMLV